MKQYKTRLAIADECQIIIDGFLSLLQGHQSLDVVITNTCALELLNQLASNPVDILLADVMMPGMYGDVLARKVNALYPNIRILALSMHGQDMIVNKMIADANIYGCLLKNAGKPELIAAIEKVAAGDRHFSDDLLLQVQNRIHLKRRNGSFHLTDREMEVLRLIEK